MPFPTGANTHSSSDVRRWTEVSFGLWDNFISGCTSGWTEESQKLHPDACFVWSSASQTSHPHENRSQKSLTLTNDKVLSRWSTRHFASRTFQPCDSSLWTIYLNIVSFLPTGATTQFLDSSTQLNWIALHCVTNTLALRFISNLCLLTGISLQF